MKKTFYKIMLENEQEYNSKQEIAKVRSKGLAYSTLKFYKENIYNKSYFKLTIE